MQKIINKSMLKKISSNRYVRFFILFILGVVSSQIFPPYKNAILGYGALLYFLHILYNSPATKKELFKRAYIFGAGFYIAGFSWINNALLVDGDTFVAYIPVVIIAIGLFFGLFWAIPAISISYGKTLPTKVLYFCASYVLFEWIRSFIFTGFPWNLLGTGLAFSPSYITLGAYIGTYGLSLILILALSALAIIIPLKENTKQKIILFIIPTSLILSSPLLYSPTIEYQKDFMVRIVQPNIPQTLKWDKEKFAENFAEHLALSKAPHTKNLKMIVWGEAATPYALDYDEQHLKEIAKILDNDSILITGLLRYAYENGDFVPYNSLFAINSSANILDYYDKSHLVPFGEYLPFRNLLPDFMTPIANVVGDIGKGEKYKNIKVKGFPLMGGAICYESIFPHEVINQNEKPELLLVLANDGWYGISNGPYQHLVSAQMRAIEEGITIIRSANTGISAVIAPNGEILSQLGLNQKGYIDVLLPKTLSKITPYQRYGNTIPLAIIILMYIIATIFNRKKSA